MNLDYEFDINAPQEYVYNLLTDVHGMHGNLPANISLRSEKGDGDLSIGSIWIVKAERSGRNFSIRNEIMDNQPPTALKLHSSSNRLETDFDIEFIAKGTTTTVSINSKLEPKGLLGRILLQSIKASKTRVDNAFQTGMSRVALYVEEQYEKDTNT